uniref:Clc-like protein n=1 Tax=Acrobeloides nanus TaxID=290746 RepID=A0A914BY11_9BILA
MHHNAYRRGFLLASILLTLLGIAISAIGIGLSSWQVVEIREFNSVHEHGIFWDCVRSELAPLAQVRDSSPTEGAHEQWTRKCVYKMDSSAENTIRFAIEEGDASARELFLHRFLPQHKAVIFFFVFTAVFGFISMIIAACSSCFLPNSIFHVFSVTIAMSCSFLGDVIFFLASMRVDNRYVHGVVDVYSQRIGYAFFIHVSASFILVFASICSILSAYFLLRTKWLASDCCPTKRKAKNEFNCESYCQFPSVSFYGQSEMETRLTDNRIAIQHSPLISAPRLAPAPPRRNNMATFGASRCAPHERTVPLATEEET